MIRLHLAAGMSQRAVARELGVSRKTIRKVQRTGATTFEYVRTKAVPCKAIGAYIEQLHSLLEFDTAQAVRFRRTAKRLYEALAAEGYAGSYATVQRAVKKWKQNHAVLTNAYVPLDFAKGEAFQFDFSQEIVEIASVQQTVHVAQFKLCFSRKEFIVAFPSEALEMILQAHVVAHDFFGGLCTRGIYDNPKPIVLKVGRGKEREFNPRFLECASHYLFKPTACTTASGWEKGRVERQVETVRDRYFKPLLRFASLAELNAYLAAKCQDEARIRRHTDYPERTIHEVFQEEKAYLCHSQQAFEASVITNQRVSKHGLVNLCGNYYSVPCVFANGQITVKKAASYVHFAHEGRLVATHERSFEKHRYITDIMHYIPLLERKPGAVRNGRPFLHLSPELQNMRLALEHYDDFDHQFAKILLQIKEYGLEAVCVACEVALESGTASSSVVINYIHRLHEDTQQTTISVSNKLQLIHPPVADCAKYNQVMGL